MRSKTKEIDTDTESATWDDMVEMKQRINNQETIKCDIENVSIGFESTNIIISPVSSEIQKSIQLDSKIYSDKESEFESFLKSNGISPTEDDIKNKLLNIQINVTGEIRDGKIIFALHDLDKNIMSTTDEKSKSNISDIDSISKIMIASFSISTPILLVSMMAPYMGVRIFSILVFLFSLSCVLYLYEEHGVFEHYIQN